MAEIAAKDSKSQIRRFIYASSSSVYGEAESFSITEEHTTSSRTIYGKTKLIGEECLKFAGNKLDVIVLRKSNLYGYGLTWKGKTVIDSFIKSYLDKQPIKINGNGTQKRDFVHIMDICSLYSRIARSRKARTGIYNVGGPETLSMNRLANMVNEIGLDIFGYTVPITYLPQDNGSAWHDFVYDCQKARMEFQYVPKFTIDYYVRERMLIALR